MKKIKIENGEVRNGYEFKDLTNEVKESIINEYINFEIEVMDEDSPYIHCAERMEEMQTPWFLGSYIYDNHKDDIIETIVVNEYLFDIAGDIIHIIHHDATGKYTFKCGKTEYKCTIENS